MTNIEDRNSPTWRDENLLIVCAVEGYTHRHNMTTSETLKLFREYGVTNAIRKCYNTLHTQDIDETVYFAEDYKLVSRKFSGSFIEKYIGTHGLNNRVVWKLQFPRPLPLKNAVL